MAQALNPPFPRFCDQWPKLFIFCPLGFCETFIISYKGFPLFFSTGATGCLIDIVVFQYDVIGSLRMVVVPQARLTT